MHYTALRFDTDAADEWSDALLASGALCVDATDPNAGTPSETPQYAEPGEPGAALWPTSRLVALFAEGADAELALCESATALGRPVPKHDRWLVAEQDWVRATQAQFGPIRIADTLSIVPTWCDPPHEGHAIRLDPGLAFGTGSHPTTRLCLEWLLAHLRPGDAVLDYGCGSGVLAIAAAKLGAHPVHGTDIDAQAIRASAANAELNHVSATFAPPEAVPQRTFDIVVANILANPLLLLAPAIAARVVIGGRLALSGILEAQADEVIASYSAWFKLRAWRATEGWVLLAGERFSHPSR